MHNINELESKWLRYKIKSLLPYLILLLIIPITAYLILTHFFVNDSSKETVNNSSITPSHEELKPEKTIIKENKLNVRTIQEKSIVNSNDQIKTNNNKLLMKDKVILQPSLNFMKNIQLNSVNYNENKQIEETKKKEKVKTKIAPKKIKEIPITEVVKVETIKDSFVNIKRDNTQDDIQHVIKRFKKSNNPALSLFIAKKYYEIKNYNQAYNYALITNEINNDIEESWIIFAKSLVKLGKKDKAIKMLKKYIQNTDSQRAKLLLDNIRSGKTK